MGVGITPIQSVTTLICRAALMYRLWLEGIRHGGVAGFMWRAGLEIITLVSWNSPLEPAAKVKGRPERSPQTGSGGGESRVF